jgi:hypothetical protein
MGLHIPQDRTRIKGQDTEIRHNQTLLGHLTTLNATNIQVYCAIKKVTHAVYLIMRVSNNRDHD